MYDIAVIIGRFQPIHKGHIPAFRRAEALADRTVCVIGSINKPSTPENPFSFDQRKELIEEAMLAEDIPMPYTVGVPDTFYREQEWYRNVKKELEPIIEEVKGYKEAKIGDILDNRKAYLNDHIDTDWDLYLELHGHYTYISKQILEYKKLKKEIDTVNICVIGYEKDASSYYLHNFADWTLELISGNSREIKHDKPISATSIRELWFEGKLSFAASNLHSYTYSFMSNYNENDFLDLQENYQYVKEYIKTTQVGPFPVQFLTTDAVVIHGDEILLIKRGLPPGKGLWALPGGFKGYNETFFQTCLRELREETRIDVPEKVIRGSLKEEKIFDFPKRSSRGTTVSMAYLFVLDPTRPRPRVKGGDDAVTAWWFSLSEVSKMRDQIFEDHPDIIDYMTARI